MKHCKQIVKDVWKKLRLLDEQCKKSTGFFQVFQSSHIPSSQNYTLPSVLQCPGKNTNPASSAEMQRSHCSQPSAKPQFCNSICRAAWKSTVAGKWEHLPHIAVGLALLCFPPLLFLLTMQTVRTVTAADGAYLNCMRTKILGKRMWIILMLCCGIRVIVHSVIAPCYGQDSQLQL